MPINIIRKLLKIKHEDGLKERYIARIELSRVIDVDELAERVGRGSTFAPAEVKGVLDEVAYYATALMADGHPVDLGELGRLYPSIDAKGCDTAKEVTEKSVKSIDVTYRPKKAMKEKLAKAGVKLRTKEVFAPSKRSKDLIILEDGD